MTITGTATIMVFTTVIGITMLPAGATTAIHTTGTTGASTITATVNTESSDTVITAIRVPTGTFVNTTGTRFGGYATAHPPSIGSEDAKR